MQQHTLARFPGSIQPVADYRTAQSQRMGGVESQLVGTAGKRDKLYPGPAPVCGKFSPPRYSRLAVNRIIDLVRPVLRIKPKGQFHLTFLSGYHPFKDGTIALTHHFPGKLI